MNTDEVPCTQNTYQTEFSAAIINLSNSRILPQSHHRRDVLEKDWFLQADCGVEPEHKTGVIGRRWAAKRYNEFGCGVNKYFNSLEYILINCLFESLKLFISEVLR